MSALEKLLNAHKPLGIYNIQEGSNIYYELSAYASGLELLENELKTIEREAFLASAENYGLSMWEKLWGAPREDLSADKRREMLLARSAFGYEDFTPQGISKVLCFLGVEGAIKEYPEVFRVTVDLSEKSFSQGQRNLIASQLQSVFPAHIEADPVFAGFDWNTMESKNLTFDNMENKGMIWSKIDILV